MHPLGLMLWAIPSRLLTLALLWAPALLVLVALVPIVDRIPLAHLATATALTLIGERALKGVLLVPSASAGDGRHRVIPRHPWWGVWAAAIGLGVWGYGFWDASAQGFRLLTMLSIPAGLGCLIAGWRYRHQSLWGAWLELEGGCLKVCAPDGGYTVPLGQIRAVHQRVSDGSFYIETPWLERNTLILTRAARGRFWVEGDAALLDQIAAHGAKIQQVSSLWKATRRSEA